MYIYITYQSNEHMHAPAVDEPVRPRVVGRRQPGVLLRLPGLSLLRHRGPAVVFRDGPREPLPVGRRVEPLGLLEHDGLRGIIGLLPRWRCRRRRRLIRYGGLGLLETGFGGGSRLGSRRVRLYRRS